MSRSLRRQYATTGAPVRSEPKLGNDCVLTLFESSERQQVRSGDDALAAPAVQSHFEHSSRLLQG